MNFWVSPGTFGGVPRISKEYGVRESGCMHILVMFGHSEVL